MNINRRSTVFRMILAVATLACMPVQAQTGTAAVGAPAPNVLLHFVDGNSAELSQWLGQRPVYLKMWATWCAECRAEMPKYKELYDRYGQEVAFFSVNAGFNDTVSDVREFNAQYGLEIPSVIDASGQVAQSFGLKATPYNVLIDASGTVVHLAVGTDDRVGALLAGFGQTPGVDPSSASTPSLAADPDVPQAGDPAPAFSITTLAGSEFTLGGDEAKRGPTYLLFFTSWCEWYMGGEDEGQDPAAASACEATRRALDAAFADPGSQPRVIGIASRLWTGPEELAEYQERFKPPYPIALDETNEVFQRYGVRTFPTLITIVDGRIHQRQTGALTQVPRP